MDILYQKELSSVENTR